MVGVNISHSYFHPGGAHITRVKIISHRFLKTNITILCQLDHQCTNAGAELHRACIPSSLCTATMSHQ